MTIPLHASLSPLRRAAPLVLSAGLLLCGATASLNAQTIISDGFGGPNDTNGATLNGRTPDTTDLPGGTYTTSTQNSGPYQQPTISTAAGGSSANTGFNGSDSISVASTGTFTKPTMLTLSASIEINNLQDDGSAMLARGIGLGFFTAPPANGGAANGNTNFYGLDVAPGGALYLEENGTRIGSAIAPAFTGFSTSNFYTLSYTVNTVTGGISNISFGGNNDGSAAADFTDAITNRAGFYGSTANNAAFNGFVDNFEVSGVPEPSTWATMIGGLALLGGAQRLRRPRRA